MANPKALLLAGGLGTRLRPLTLTLPKCLVPIGGKPLLEYWIDALLSASIDRVLINTHHLRKIVQSAIADINRRETINLEETFEPVLLGSAGTIANNPNFADGADEVIIIYTDNLSSVDLSELLAFHRSHMAGFSMMLFHTENPQQCGIAEMDGSGTIITFDEKPAEPKSNLANAGLYVVDAKIYWEIANLQAYDLAKDVIPVLIGRMKGFVFGGYHRDIGTPQALKTACEDVAAGRFL